MLEIVWKEQRHLGNKDILIENGYAWLRTVNPVMLWYRFYSLIMSYIIQLNLWLLLLQNFNIKEIFLAQFFFLFSYTPRTLIDLYPETFNIGAQICNGIWRMVTVRSEFWQNFIYFPLDSWTCVHLCCCVRSICVWVVLPEEDRGAHNKDPTL